MRNHAASVVNPPASSAHSAHSVPSVALCALLAMAAGTATAETSPYYIGGAQAFSHETNALRLGDSESPPEGYSRSDTISSTSLLAGLNQPFGRQRAYANLALRSTRYSNNSVFDNQGYSANAGLDWSTIERVSGTLKLSANRALASFGITEVGLLSQKNLETTQALDATVSVGLVTQYSFEAALGHRRVRNSLDQSTIQSRNFDQDNASVGVRWRPTGASNFGLSVGGAKGRYPQFRTNATGDGYVEDRFTRRDIELTAGLQPSGLSSLDARLSVGKTSYDLNNQRDFSGVTGSIGWMWQPTGKLRFNSRISRDTGQDSYATTVFSTPGLSDYSQTTSSLRIVTDYELSAKVGLNAALQVVQRKLVRTIDNPFIPLNAEGKDRTTLLSLGARWTPLRNALLGCDLSNENRSASGQLTTPLSNRGVSCFGQLTLQ